MAFPVVLHGPDGEQFSTYTAQRWPLGTQLVMQDGRKFRYCENNGSTAMTASAVQQAAANVANHVTQVQTSGAANAIGARAITFRQAGTSSTANQYAEGMLAVTDGTGEGYIHKVLSHAAFAGVATNETVNLAPGHSIQVATDTATDLSIVNCPYKDVLIYPTTSTQVHVGVGVKPLAVDNFGWLATRGLHTVLANSTWVLGDGLYVASTTAGSASPTTTTFAVAYTRIIGFVALVSASTEYGIAFLTIDG